MNVLERTILAFTFGAVLCHMLGGSNPDIVTAAIVSAFVPAFLGGLHLFLFKKLKRSLGKP